MEDMDDLDDDEDELDFGSDGGALGNATKDDLENMLKEALDNEDYEAASKIRDEIQKRVE